MTRMRNTHNALDLQDVGMNVGSDSRVKSVGEAVGTGSIVK